MRQTFAILAGLLAFSCSLDYSEGILPEEISDTIPNIIAYAQEFTVVRDGAVVFRLYADRVEIYDKKHEQRLFGVRFIEYDSATGEVLTDGLADFAIYNLSTKNAEFTGNLKFFTRRENANLETEYLYWVDKEKRLMGRDDMILVIKKADGSEIRGSGFSANAAERSFSFSDAVQGVIFDDGE